MAKELDVVLRLTDEEYNRLKVAREWLRDTRDIDYLSLGEVVDFITIDWLASHQIERVEGGK